MKLAILTSNQLRHRYFISRLASQFRVVGAIIETKKRDPATKGSGTSLQGSVQKYFQDREESEQQFFGQVEWEAVRARSGEVREIEAGTLNEEENVNFLRGLQPDHVAVFGSSLLKAPLIQVVPPNCIINMHLGLSPYYRGSGTNFWPLYQEKPEYVGVTIHYLDEGIDTGRIITQGRPEIVSGDTPHSIGNKTIQVGTELMVQTLDRLAAGELIPGVAQSKEVGQLCLFKDCTAEHIVELEGKFQTGLISRYLDRLNSDHAPQVKLVI